MVRRRAEPSETDDPMFNDPLHTHWRARLVLAATLLVVPACPAAPKHDEVVDIDLQRFRVDVSPGDYAIGGEHPLVTIVVWSDYACPPCGRTWQVMKNLVEDYGDDVRVVFRAGTIPGFQHGERAAEAALAAGGQGKFWDMHWRLFEYPDDFSRPVLRKHAEAIGLDVPQFLDDLDTGRHAGQRCRWRSSTGCSCSASRTRRPGTRWSIVSWSAPASWSKTASRGPTSTPSSCAPRSSVR
jgi:hypothetical protein